MAVDYIASHFNRRRRLFADGSRHDIHDAVNVKINFVTPLASSADFYRNADVRCIILKEPTWQHRFLANETQSFPMRR